MDSDRASTLEQIRVEKLCRSPKDSGRAFTLELRGGLPIGREALRHSEPHHSSDEVTPNYYTKNESFISGISKMWCVCVSTFTMRRVFIGVNRTPTDLDKSVWARWWPGGQAAWPTGRVDRPPPTRASPPCVDVWQPRLGPNRFKP
jgi:hypothetical protein